MGATVACSSFASSHKQIVISLTATMKAHMPIRFSNNAMTEYDTVSSLSGISKKPVLKTLVAHLTDAGTRSDLCVMCGCMDFTSD